jgi:hypothetical protein
LPLGSARFHGDPPVIAIAGCGFDYRDRTMTGEIEHDDGPLAWNLSFAANGHQAGPMCLLPTRKLVDSRYPKNKLLTPRPVLEFTGSISVGDRIIDVTGWHGSQGHNWGAGHSPEYAWSQCVFLGADGEPMAMMEAAAGRIKRGPFTTPTLGVMVVRRGNREYRFDRFLRIWNLTSSRDDLQWTATYTGPDGDAMVTMTASAEEMVCLGYYNPDGELSYCLNSKLAHARLRVNPVNEPGFECVSEHGGALEFLQGTPDARIPGPV